MKFILTSSNGSQLNFEGQDTAAAIEYFLTNIDSNGSKQLTVKEIKGWFSCTSE